MAGPAWNLKRTSSSYKLLPAQGQQGPCISAYLACRSLAVHGIIVSQTWRWFALSAYMPLYSTKDPSLKTNKHQLRTSTFQALTHSDRQVYQAKRATSVPEPSLSTEEQCQKQRALQRLKKCYKSKREKPRTGFWGTLSSQAIGAKEHTANIKHIIRTSFLAA